MVLKPMWHVCVCELSMRERCAWAWNLGPVTFDLGSHDLDLGIIVVLSDGSTHDGALPDVVSFLVQMKHCHLSQKTLQE